MVLVKAEGAKRGFLLIGSRCIPQQAFECIKACGGAELDIHVMRRSA
jgi:hypothetical protein